MDARQRLVESAQELLWERGYVGMSPRAIQRYAGAGQGSMYHHFAGKLELASVALRRTATAMWTDAAQRLGGPYPPLQRIARYLEDERDVLRGCRLGRLVQDPEVVLRPELREPIAEAFSRQYGLIQGVLQEGQGKGEIPADLDVADVSAMIAAVLQGGYVLARAAGSVEPFHQAIRGCLALLGAPGRPSAGKSAPDPVPSGPE